MVKYIDTIKCTTKTKYFAIISFYKFNQNEICCIFRKFIIFKQKRQMLYDCALLHDVCLELKVFRNKHLDYV